MRNISYELINSKVAIVANQYSRQKHGFTFYSHLNSKEAQANKTAQALTKLRFDIAKKEN